MKRSLLDMMLTAMFYVYILIIPIIFGVMALDKYVIEFVVMHSFIVAGFIITDKR